MDCTGHYKIVGRVGGAQAGHHCQPCASASCQLAAGKRSIARQEKRTQVAPATPCTTALNASSRSKHTQVSQARLHHNAPVMTHHQPQHTACPLAGWRTCPISPGTWVRLHFSQELVQ